MDGARKVLSERSQAGGAGHFIQHAIKHPGALHKEMGVPVGTPIPEGKLRDAAGGGGKLGQRARFALVLKSLHHGEAPEPEHLEGLRGDAQ